MTTKTERASAYPGMNQGDVDILTAVESEIVHAKYAPTQRTAMNNLLFARHLLDTLLRRMQDN